MKHDPFVDFAIFGFFFVLHTLICLPSPRCNFFDWFSNVFPQKSCIDFVCVWLCCFEKEKEDQFLKIALPKKPLKVLYTTGCISKSRKEDELDCSTKLKLKSAPYNDTTTVFAHSVTCFQFCGSASHLHLMWTNLPLFECNFECNSQLM